MGRCEGHTAWRPILSGGSRSRRSKGIYSERELHELIVYERARADRTGNSLSLVICTKAHLCRSSIEVHRAIDLLSRSIRSTDHLGWYGHDQLGVVLPLTDHPGAERFVDEIVHQSINGPSAIARELRFTIHSYPEKWFQHSHERKARLQEPSGRRSGDTCFTYRTPIWKRTLDLTGASLGLLALSPFLALVAPYIKLVSPGPVIFKQQRVGRARREFTFYKFRTMHPSTDEGVHSHHALDFISHDRPMTKLDGEDSRIIKGGRIIRKLAIDELPQLWNILKGDMSLVGPRPCIPYEADEYQQWHINRFSILPGLTGLWQVSGKNKLTFQQMIRLDIEYARRMSLRYDLWLILRTVPTLIELAAEGTAHRLRLFRRGLGRSQEADTPVATQSRSLAPEGPVRDAVK